MQDNWEVEQKFVLETTESFLKMLAAAGFEHERSERNCDVYFRHPCRDFRATDEAFRLRTLDSSTCVTYKGKRLPGAVKTRPEIELDVTYTDRQRWLDLIEQLGFIAWPAVEKTRQIFIPTSNSPYANSDVQVMLDEVPLLGHFAEIELVITDAGQLAAAGQRISALASRLGLSVVQPRSYLSLVLEKLGIE